MKTKCILHRSVAVFFSLALLINDSDAQNIEFKYLGTSGDAGTPGTAFHVGKNSNNSATDVSKYFETLANIDDAQKRKLSAAIKWHMIRSRNAFGININSNAGHFLLGGTNRFGIMVNGKSVAIGGGSRAGESIAGADRIKSFNPQTSTLIDEASKRLLENKFREFVTWGDPVGPYVGIDPFTGTIADAVNIPDLDQGGSSACNNPGNFNRCYLPAVALHDQERTHCTGVLLSPRWVLTAAHCVCNASFSQVTAGNRVGFGSATVDSSVTVSIDDLNVGDGLHYADGASRFCNAYANDQKALATYRNGDAALIRLRRPIQSAYAPASRTLYAAIAHENHYQGGKVLEVVGFGKRHNDSKGGEKFFSSLSVQSDYCALHSNICDSSFEFAALETRGLSDSCYGDSGAGVYARLADGRLALVGIVSRGINHECGPGGIYVNVTVPSMRDWIKSIVSSATQLTGSEPLAPDILRLSQSN